MAAPLASLVLLLVAASPAAAESRNDVFECPFVLRTEDGAKVNFFTEKWPECQALVAMRSDFEALRKAAGLGEEVTLSAQVDKNANALYYFPRKSVVFTTGFLRGNYDPAVRRWAAAHELGHAVQEHGPEMLELLSARSRRRQQRRANRYGPEELAEYNTFMRRYEGQADAIAQELIARAGLPLDSVRHAVAGIAGCSRLGDLEPKDETDEHPTDAQRLVNATLGQDVLARSAKAKLGEGAGFFDGTGIAATLVTSSDRVYQPVAKLSHFGPNGELRPGRLAVRDLRIEVPLAGAAPTALAVPFAAYGLLLDGYAAAVDRLAAGDAVTRAALRACGTPASDELANEMGVWDWSRRIAEALSRRRSSP